MSTFKSDTWKQVTVGNLDNAKTARKLLEDGGIKIGRWSGDTLNRATFEDTEATLDLVRVSAEELGLKFGATMSEIYTAAARHGLSLCPAEVAPQLWLQYPDLLLRGEWFVVAMEAIVNSGGDRSVFSCAHLNDGSWLGAEGGSPDDRCNEHTYWVFVRK